ncbi:MAG: adenylate/guanylate cyclase domain-containing protein [Myxococcaceae bacterium]|nr:adenylate/guanylate cyclase domain-containing protein [Myxococcaceae bacterium]
MKHALHLIRLRLARTWQLMLLISIGATAIAIFWWQNNFLDIRSQEWASYDSGLQLFIQKLPGDFAKPKKSDDIVIIAIDDTTFDAIDASDRTQVDWKARYGLWPYDRRIWADVIDYLSKAGARLLVMDMVLDTARSDESGDVAMAEAMRTTRFPVYLGFNVIPKGDTLFPGLPKVEPKNRPMLSRTPAPGPSLEKPASPPQDDSAFEEAPEVDFAAAMNERRQLAAVAYAFPLEMKGGLEAPVFSSAGEPRFPKPAVTPLLTPTSGFGSVVPEFDDDGKMRRTRFVWSDGINPYLSLPVAAAADWFNAETVTVQPGLLTLGTHPVPINPDGSAEINYGGKLFERFPVISLVDVLRHRGANDGYEKFKDKFVLIGGISLGTGDTKATPLDEQSPGVIKQAAVLDNLLHRRFILEAPFWVSCLVALALAFLSISIILVVRSPFVEIGWPLLLFVTFFVVPGWVTVSTHIHVLSVMPSLAGTFASVAGTVFNHFFAEKERERLKAMFASYMEADLLEQMVEARELPKLDGEKHHITAFFSDIKGFSTFSERFREDPKGLMRLMNRYLSTVTAVLTHHGACIDKYIGDAVVALFGAPVKHADHALRACKGALDVQKAIAALREAFRAEGLPDVYTRIGLNTDDLLVGNIGSEQLMDYTAIGDGMNLAARLEGANKAYGTLIMMGENTYLQVKDDVEARELDTVRVAGKTQAVRVYELLALKGQLPAAKALTVAHYAQALALYRERQFAEASKVLHRVLDTDPADGPSQHLLERCQSLRDALPDSTWDSVTSLDK